MEFDNELLSEAEICDLVSYLRLSEGVSLETDGAAASIIHDFCLRQWSGRTPSPTAMDWLAESLGKILDHADAQTAFGLAKRASNAPKSKNKFERDGWIAIWIAQTVARGYTVSEAQDLASEQFGTVRRNIQRIPRESVSTDTRVNWEQVFLSIRRPLPPRQ